MALSTLFFRGNPPRFGPLGLTVPFIVMFLLTWPTFIELHGYDVLFLAHYANPIAQYIGPVCILSMVITGVLLGLCIPYLVPAHYAIALGIAAARLVSLPPMLSTHDWLVPTLGVGAFYLLSVSLVVIFRPVFQPTRP